MFSTRTEQTTNSSGTGSLVLNAPLTGRKSFVSSFGVGNYCYYFIQTADESQWEEGVGQITSPSSVDTLVRLQVLQSSNSNNLVNFPSGTHTAFSGMHSDTIRFGMAGQFPTSSGSSAAQTLSYAPPVRHLRAGMIFRFISGFAGTGSAVSLNINSLGAVSVKSADGVTDPDAYDLRLNQAATVMYDGSKFLIIESGRMANRNYVDDVITNAITGMIGFFPSTDAPAGWLKCNGALLSRSTYSRLFSYVASPGTWFTTDAIWLSGYYAAFSSGNGSTTFRIPEMRGDFIRAFDDGRGIDAGRPAALWQDQAFLSHGHPANVTDPTHKHNMNVGQGSGGIQGFNFVSGNSTANYAGIQFAATGISVSISNSGGVETRPRNIPLLACIKY